MSQHTITAFLGVFEQKLERHRAKLKAELKKPKEERRKKVLKESIAEAKKLRDMVREMRSEEAELVQCPNCQHEFKP
ncbi:MAG: hypothetical protein HKN70_01975 [Gammaproteobacteria bacterium]|nr:hypothetical protein [Gammaproteobacteria bacterium]